MKLTKSQKVWLCVLGVAGVAMTVDQLFGGPTPLAAVARDRLAPPVVVPVATGHGVPAAAAGLSGFDAPLAARLDDLGRRVGDGGVGRDAFVPAAGWGGRPRPVPVDRGRVAADRSAAFERAHVLKVTLASENGGGQAVVDGDLIAVGEPIDGFRLVSVGRLRATFVADDGARAELSLAETGTPVPR